MCGNGCERWGTAKTVKRKGSLKKSFRINVMKSASQASDEGSIPFTRSMIDLPTYLCENGFDAAAICGPIAFSSMSRFGESIRLRGMSVVSARP
jgi:hypothetical protein